MSLRVHIHNSSDGDVPLARLEAAAGASLRQAQRTAGAVTIRLVDDEVMSQFHLEYLGEEKTTDVLSFPHGEIDPETGLPYFGDILISWPRARQQAQDAGHSVEDELTLLTVHGVLHLLGYDHAEEKQKQVMWRLQQEILDSLGVSVEMTPIDE
jgi:probable rRNA maturation factor